MKVTPSRYTFGALSAAVGGGKTPYIFTRQSHSAKLAHNEDLTDKFEQIVCYMLPHSLARKTWLSVVGTPPPWRWRNVCPHSTPGCRGACLVHSGRLGMAPSIRAMLARNALYSGYNDAFWELVVDEVGRHKRRVERKGARLVVRLDGTSQINILEKAPHIVESFPEVIFQDYLKGPYKTGWVAPNRYQVASATEKDTAVTIKGRGNVVFPVDIKRGDPLPHKFMGRSVVNGDKHDLRFMDDQSNMAVLVRAKGYPENPHGFIWDAS
jgi:hypothetical protein